MKLARPIALAFIVSSTLVMHGCSCIGLQLWPVCLGIPFF